MADVFNKILDTNTPNVSQQENTAVSLLMGTAGRLTGLELIPPLESIVLFVGNGLHMKLSPGSFIHRGIIVSYPEGRDFTLKLPDNFPLNDTLNLIAQAAGPVAGVEPVWSFISGTALAALPDYKNYAAVIATYRLRLTTDSMIAEIVNSTDSSPLGWTAINPPAGSNPHAKILNGIAGAYLQAGSSLVDVVKLAALPSGSARNVTQAALSITVAAESTNATIATGAITVAGSAPSSGDRFSAYANGLEAFYVAQPGDAITDVANGLINAINDIASLWTGLAVATTGGGGLINISSSIKGKQANFDLQVTTDSATTTLTRTTPMGGGTQSYLVVDFPVVGGGTSGVMPMTIYPPLPSSPSAMARIDVPLEISGLTADTFNQLLIRLTSYNLSTDKVYVSYAALQVHFDELNNGIDPAPPTNLFHWAAGPLVSVGGSAEGSSLQGHRTANPFDHPARSVPRTGIMIGAVGVSEIDSGIVGSFSAHAHIPGDNSLSAYPIGLPPWLVVGDFNIHELSDLLKEVAFAVSASSSTSGITVDHDIVPGGTGHHKSVSYAGFSGVKSPNTGATDLGFVLLPVVSGENGAAGGVTPLGDTTRGMLYVKGGSDAQSAILYTRDAEIGTLGQTSVFGITSKTVAGAGNSANTETILEVTTAPTPTGSRNIARFGRKDAGAYELYGVSAIDGIPVSSLAGQAGQKVSLFNGCVAFIRNGNTSLATGKTMIHDDCNVNGYSTTGALGADGTGAIVYGSTPNSRIGRPGGFAMYAKRRGANPIQMETSLSMLDSAYFDPDAPVVNSYYPPADSKKVTASYLYLPFRSKGVYDTITISASIVFSLYENIADNYKWTDPGYFNVGFQVAPAYDVLGIPTANLVAPTVAPARTGIWPGAPAGIVRRHPWVLTPAGSLIKHGTSVNDGIYFDASNFFTGTPESRTSNFKDNPPADSMFSPNPLPFYNTSSSGGGAGGILIVANQVTVAVGKAFWFSNAGGAYGANTVQGMATVNATLNLRDIFSSGGDRIIFPGSSPDYEPDGIAINTQFFDAGLNGTVDRWYRYPPITYDVQVRHHYFDMIIDGITGSGNTYSLTP